jgi:FtsH-binding integral membrane protein
MSSGIAKVSGVQPPLDQEVEAVATAAFAKVQTALTLSLLIAVCCIQVLHVSSQLAKAACIHTSMYVLCVVCVLLAVICTSSRKNL